jgi:Domain of unknown function (DUF5753)
MDEGALHRCIGGPKVMRDQLLHLEEVSHQTRVDVQIVPAEVGTHAGLLGAFVIATNATDTIYLVTAGAGQITELPSVVDEITLTWEALRSEALPRGPIARVAKWPYTPSAVAAFGWPSRSRSGREPPGPRRRVTAKRRTS